MATLSGNKVKDTYSSLLKLESNGVTSTLKTVEDGAGTDSALKLSTDTVEVNGTLSFTTAPTTSSDELTGLFIDGSNNIVKRDLDSSAFSASTQVFANPMFILRPSASYTLTDTAATPTQAGVNNNGNSTSHLVNDSSNAHLQTSSTTTGAVTVEAAGLIKIDVNFVLEVTASNTDITINVKEKASGGSASTIQSIVRSKSAAGNMAIGFSLIRHASEDMDIYYEISKNSSGGASLLTTSTFSITKLD
jgi:hypothetical protein